MNYSPVELRASLKRVIGATERPWTKLSDQAWDDLRASYACPYLADLEVVYEKDGPRGLKKLMSHARLFHNGKYFKRPPVWPDACVFDEDDNLVFFSSPDDYKEWVFKHWVGKYLKVILAHAPISILKELGVNFGVLEANDLVA